MGKNRQKAGRNSNSNSRHYTNESWKTVETIKDIENLTGYSITFDDEGNMNVQDDEHGTTIIIDKYYLQGAGKRLLNTKNNGAQAKDVGENTKHPDLATYDLKDVIRIYNEAPDMLKDANGLIVFRKDNINNNILGEHIARGQEHAVVINPASFGKKDGAFNLSKALYHEMGHGLDYNYNYLHPHEAGLDTFGLSSGNARFRELVKTPVTEYASFYAGTPDYYKENFAESVGIVATYNNGNHDFVVDTYRNGRVPVKQWVNENKELVAETNKVLKGDFNVFDENSNTENGGYYRRWLSNPKDVKSVREKAEINWDNY